MFQSMKVMYEEIIEKFFFGLFLKTGKFFTFTSKFSSIRPFRTFNDLLKFSISKTKKHSCCAMF